MKAVILIHGFITDQNDFNPLYSSLNERYDLVHKFILPGHGKNYRYKDFKFDKTIELLKNTIDNISISYDTIDLIGFSLGGALVSACSKYPKINKIVMISPANKYIRFGFITRYRRSLIKFKRQYKVLKKKNDLRAYEYAKKILDISENNKRSIRLALFKLLPHYTFFTLKTFSKLIKWCNRNISVNNNKSLILWGELDQLVPYKSVKFINKFFKNLKVIVYNDISHLMLLSINSDKIKKDIIKFLDDETI